MIKTVNVKTTLPIRIITPKLNGNTFYPKLRLNAGDILNCMMMRASVDEVLADGSIISLNRSNYNKINGAIPSENVVIVTPNAEDKKPATPTIDESDKVDDEDPKLEAKDPPSIEEDNSGLPPHDVDESVEVINTSEDEESNTTTDTEHEPVTMTEVIETHVEDDQKSETNSNDVVSTMGVDDDSQPQEHPDVVEPPKIQNNNQNQSKGKKKH